eukprot:2607014-Pleurochrysis_carterae.AAC.1
MVGMEGKTTLLMFLVGEDRKWLYVKPERVGMETMKNAIQHAGHYLHKRIHGVRETPAVASRRETARRKNTVQLINEALRGSNGSNSKEKRMYGLRGPTREEYNRNIESLRTNSFSDGGGSEMVVNRSNTNGITNLSSLVEFMHDKMTNARVESAAFIFPVSRTTNNQSRSKSASNTLSSPSRRTRGLDGKMVDNWLKVTKNNQNISKNRYTSYHRISSHDQHFIRPKTRNGTDKVVGMTIPGENRKVPLQKKNRSERETSVSRSSLVSRMSSPSRRARIHPQTSSGSNIPSVRDEDSNLSNAPTVLRRSSKSGTFSKTSRVVSSYI